MAVSSHFGRALGCRGKGAEHTSRVPEEMRLHSFTDLWTISRSLCTTGQLHSHGSPARAQAFPVAVLTFESRAQTQVKLTPAAKLTANLRIPCRQLSSTLDQSLVWTSRLQTKADSMSHLWNKRRSVGQRGLWLWLCGEVITCQVHCSLGCAVGGGSHLQQD